MDIKPTFKNLLILLVTIIIVKHFKLWDAIKKEIADLKNIMGKEFNNND